ncbi:MAG: mevalonate kinase family protein [Calditrichia bacterium]
MSSASTTTFSSPGKLILIGEYAVLEKAPAVVMAVNRTANVAIRKIDGPAQVSAPGLHIHNAVFHIEGDTLQWSNCSTKQQQALRFFEAAIIESRMVSHKTSPLPLINVHFRLDTAQFYLPGSTTKLGFGSSASLTYAVVSAALNHMQPQLQQSPQLLLPIASAAHYRAQKKVGSGIDVAAAAYTGLLKYELIEKNNPTTAEVTPLSWPDDLHLSCVFSGKAVSTRDLVATIYTLKQNKLTQFVDHISVMTSQATDACSALAHADTARFVDIADAYGDSMRLLGEAAGADIVSEDHKQLKQIANAQGAAYKPSGAGGGDIGVALSTSKDCILRSEEAFRKAGYLVIDLAPYYRQI